MKKIFKAYRLIPILFVGFFIVSTVEAKRLEDVKFEAEQRVQKTTFALQGAGLIKHLMFTVNASALYLAEDIDVEDPLEDIPKRLEFEYFHKIKAKDFAKLTSKWIEKNNDAETIKRLQPQIDRFNALYKDVRPGDRYAITYKPGKGTELALNGKVQGVVGGADFARALFSIWLGPKPVSKSLKLALLK